MIDLQSRGCSLLYAASINDAGQIAGLGTHGYEPFRAFLCHPHGNMIDLGALAEGDSWAHDITDHGLVAGYSYDLHHHAHAILWGN